MDAPCILGPDALAAPQGRLGLTVRRPIPGAHAAQLTVLEQPLFQTTACRALPLRRSAACGTRYLLSADARRTLPLLGAAAGRAVACI